jgi:hypothetical protein
MYSPPHDPAIQYTALSFECKDLLIFLAINTIIKLDLHVNAVLVCPAAQHDEIGKLKGDPRWRV